MSRNDDAFSMWDVFPPMHREGHRFVLAGGAVAVLAILFGWGLLAWIAILFAVFCAYFFRNPDRIVPDRADVLVSPADGRVQAISTVKPPHELDMGEKPVIRVSIFLSVLDVHVNRVPASGRIDKRVYIPGAFLNASLDKASEQNERMLLRMSLEDGRQVGFVQIAGLVARRIVCHVNEGDEVEAGERFGIIRFGSRMDIYLPDGMTPYVAVGQRTLGGETIIAVPEAEMAGSFSGTRR